MSRIALTIARFTLAAWVGAAALFVVNGIRQAIHPAFDSTIRNQLALIRFPAYYAFGFTLVSLGLLSLLAGRRVRPESATRTKWAIAMTASSLVLMAVDYGFVYLPLEAMITPPATARPAEFITYHRASEMLNTLHVGLICAAAILINTPTSTDRPPSSR